MSQKILQDKIAVITGGGRGIGFEIAENFLKSGAKTIIILDLNESEGQNAVKALTSTYGKAKAVFYKCDVTTDLETVSTQIFNSYKTIDVLVNNAGISNETAFKKCVDINLTSVIAWSYAFFEHMRKDRGGNGGTIFNIASIFGYRVLQFIPVYVATKFGVMGFTRSLGNQENLRETGVRVIALCPGFTKTQLTDVVDKTPWGFDIPSLAKRQNECVLNEFDWQEVDVVGRAAAEVFKKAESGSAWLIEGGKPIEEII